MTATHKTTLHGRCPLDGHWNYYEATIEIDGFIDTAEIEKACDSVRGREAFQEDVAKELKAALPDECWVTLEGRHSQNTSTTVRV